MRKLSTVMFVLSCAATVSLAAIAPMPYRPGYGLGSWIPPTVVESMRREAEHRVEILNLDSVDSEVRGVEREIAMIIDQSTDNETTTQATEMLHSIRQSRRDIMTKKMTAVQAWLNHTVGFGNGTVAKNATATNSTEPEGTFATFGRAAESPLDWKTATVTPVDRAFDSINIGVHYVRNEHTSQKGGGASHASRVGRELKNITHSVTGRSNDVQRDAARLAADKTASTSENHNVVGTLLITAFATHRMVKQITNIQADADKLWRGWNFHFPADRVADPMNQYDNFTRQLDVEKVRDPNAPRNFLSLVTEMYMGSVVIGMVHFISNETTEASTSQHLNNTQQKFNHDISFNVRQAQKAASAVGSSTAALEDARKLAELGSSAGLNVQFDLVSIGFIPALTTDPIQQAVSQFANFDPAAFKVPTSLIDAPVSAGLEAVKNNMAAVIDATVSALAKQQTAQRDILNEKSLMNAFTDFATAAKAGSNIGAPIGMNVAEFTKLDVMSSLANKYLSNTASIKLSVDV